MSGKGSRRRPEASGYDPPAVCAQHGHTMPDQHGRCVRCGATLPPPLAPSRLEPR